jgi:2-methylcitrate dehydratase PrpD
MIGSGTLTRTLAGRLAQTGYDALDADAIRVTKEHILYTLGTVLAGSSAPGATEILTAARSLGAAAESTALVSGEKLPAATAALVNATMAHSRELDINDDASLINRASRRSRRPSLWPRKAAAFPDVNLSPRFV